MKVVQYLRNFQTTKGALAALELEYGIKSKLYPEYGLVCLSYSQIDSPKTEMIVRECRGLILNYELDWLVVCRPFLRFFNHGEAPETLDDFKFHRSEIFEKVDGSLIKIYRWDGKWQIATRGTAFAETENNLGRNFRDMVLESFGLSNEEFIADSDDYFYRGATHLYELVHKDNRIVTPYTKNEMVYLGSIDNDTGNYYCDNLLIGNSREANSFHAGSIEDCVNASTQLDGLQEGFVVRDLGSGQAVKVKSPLYVAAHHLRGELGLTPKKIAKLVITNETAEYLQYFPDDSDKIAPYEATWVQIQNQAELDLVMANPMEEQKEFAKLVKDLPYSSVLFSARKKEISAIEALNDASESFKIKLLLDMHGNLE